MKVITDKLTNEILAISEIAELRTNGIAVDTMIIGVAKENGIFVTPMPRIHDVEIIPENVGPNTHCYSPEKGFYENVTVYQKIWNDATDATILELINTGVI